MKTIYVLWLRQLVRYFRSKPRIIGSLGQPLLFLFSLGYGFSTVFQKAGNGSYIDFLTPGIIGMSIIFTSVFSGIELIWDRQFGFLKETLVAPVSRFHIMLGRTLGGATIATLQGMIVFIIAVIGGFRPHTWLTIPFVILAMFLVSFFFTALGTAIACKLTDMQGFQLIVNFVIMPLFFLSGALFPLDSAPQTLKILALFDPLSYGIDAFRALLINFSHFGLSVDIVILLIISGIILWIGSALFSKIQA